MKKLILLIFILFLSSPFMNVNLLLAKAQNSIFAKIENENVFLFTAPNESDKNKLFILPNSYFVQLLNEANENFYYCSYKDIKGYVKKNEVVAMKGIPQKPFIDGFFRTFSLDGLAIYSSPMVNNKNQLATIPYLTDNLIYYGEMTGQELVPDKTDQWIYCKYSAEKVICGYVYSVFCDKLPSIKENTERFEIISNPFKNSSSPQELSSVAMGFIIVGVSLPCVIVLFLLIKPTLLKEKLNTSSPKLRAKKHRDYFEFDDSDLT